ncbi:glycosyltransferase [Actinobacillus equuli subsp. haemolyticus]|nr:glycosyltransferase [Actinobacillus equuli]MDG4947321.1 glycosyltransferase [Actinobacillus equuli subsp. haemolyticus]
MGYEKMIEKKTLPSLAIVVPCYNESESFSYCLVELSKIINNLAKNEKIKPDSYILFIDDGSKDDT